MPCPYTGRKHSAPAGNGTEGQEPGVAGITKVARGYMSPSEDQLGRCIVQCPNSADAMDLSALLYV